MCAPRVLHRGRSVYDRRVRYDGESTIINAVVASQTSSTEGYRVMVELNEGADFVEDYSCTCPAAFQYDGMCKHAVALALDYAARSDSYAGFRRDRSAVSSDCIAAFMERAERLERDDTPDGSVDVLCDFTVEYGEWSMGLRVATDDATYIVKNISDFCRRLDEGTFFEYGKKLAFTHVPSRFTERDSPARRGHCRCPAPYGTAFLVAIRCSEHWPHHVPFRKRYGRCAFSPGGRDVFHQGRRWHCAERGTRACGRCRP